MNPSGGFFWHLRAWRSQALWQATRLQIGQWLAQVKPRAPELLLIGASAGWMMDSAWLQGFSRVRTFDMDPLAAPLFRARHGRALQASRTELHCHTSDALAHLPTLLQAHPASAVLFDNVLGQLRFHCRSVAETGERIERLKHALQRREWGSLHDAYSGAIRAAWPVQDQPAMRCGPDAPTSAEAAANAAWLRQMGAQGDWLDHLTADVFAPGTALHHIAWPYRPSYCHWLQAGWVH